MLSPGRVAVSRLMYDDFHKKGPNNSILGSNGQVFDLEESNRELKKNLRFRDHEKEILQNQQDYIQSLIE